MTRPAGLAANGTGPQSPRRADPGRHHPGRRGVLASGGAVLLGGIAGFMLPEILAPGAAIAATPAILTRKAIFFDPGAPILGNPHGTLPVAEFFDYRCPYCRGMHPMLQRLLAKNPDIRYVAKQWPIFGGPSVIAARVALAAWWQGRFAAVNDVLFRTHITDTASVMRAASEAGVDMARLARDMRTRRGELDATLGLADVQAHALGLHGTPGFIIGDYLIPGALREKDLAGVVRDARAKLAKQHG